MKKELNKIDLRQILLTDHLRNEIQKKLNTGSVLVRNEGTIWENDNYRL